MSPLSIKIARETSQNTELNRIINRFNSDILEAATKFYNYVNIDLSHEVPFVKKEITTGSSYIGEQAHSMLPENYKKAITLFGKEGYRFDLEYMDWYIDEVYSERWEKKFTLTIKW